MEDSQYDGRNMSHKSGYGNNDIIPEDRTDMVKGKNIEKFINWFGKDCTNGKCC